MLYCQKPKIFRSFLLLRPPLFVSKIQQTAEEELDVEKGVKFETGSPLNFIDFIIEKTEFGKKRRKMRNVCMVAPESD